MAHIADAVGAEQGGPPRARTLESLRRQRRTSVPRGGEPDEIASAVG